MINSSSSSFTESQDIDAISSLELPYKHYNLLFTVTHEKLDDLLEIDFPYNEPYVTNDRATAIRQVSKLYLKYIQITNNLIKCYKYLANPQKRSYLRKLCDGCIGRVLELKHELSSLEMSDFCFFDQTLLGLRMFPNDIDVEVPEYFRDETSNERQQKEKIVDPLLKAHTQMVKTQISVTKEVKLVRMAVVFIRMLQGHERARQSREHFSVVQKEYLQRDFLNKREIRKNMPFNTSKIESATIIQRAWRRYHSHKILNLKYLEEMKFYKMKNKDDEKCIVNDIEKNRKIIIKRNESEFLREKEKVKQDILIYQVPKMIEELEERIRNYFHEYKEINGEFPIFPSEEAGGSIALLSIAPDQVIVSAEEPKTDGKKKKKDDKKAKSSKKPEAKKPEPVEYSIKPSKYVPTIVELTEYYRHNWAGKKLNKADKFDVDLMVEDINKEISFVVREHVDKKMRAELLRLTKALKKDSKKKAKKSKKKKDKGKKKKKKAKTEIDLTPDRTVESLTEELIEQGILIDYPRHDLTEYLGEYNYSGAVQQMLIEADNAPLPCLADIRRAINEYCILPMGSAAIHSGGAFVKSILLAGPKGSGKSLLVYAICSEVGATLLNLSAENLEGKYPGEEGLEMLLHLVSKVGRLLQPTVIFIKDAENYYWKKKPRNCSLSNPGRLKKALPKLIKTFTATDRILVCGTSALPFESDVKGLSGCYSKIICIFKPDYDCRCHLWKKFITKAGGETTSKLLFSVLGNISDGFVASTIQNTVLQVLNKRRRSFQEKIPLCASDFINALAEHVPVYEEELQEYLSWLKKLPLGKKRVAYFEQEEAQKQKEDVSEEDDY